MTFHVPAVARGLALLLAILFAPVMAHARGEPGFSGIWRLEGEFAPELKTSDGAEPPLLPDAAALYHQRQAQARAGDLSFDSAATICVSPGMPRMMFLPYPFQIVQGSTHLIFLFEWNNRHRVVDMTGGDPEVIDLFYMGTASGQFQDDDLVIRTYGLTDRSLLDAHGMPHSDELVVTERYSLEEHGQRLVNEMTIEDPKTFSHPWTTRVTYRRMPAGYELKEDVCRERVPYGRPAFEYDKWKQQAGEGQAATGDYDGE